MAIGTLALEINTTGNSNTATGSNTLLANTTGSQNTTLGDNANVSTGNLTNATAIDATPAVYASNKIRQGNFNVTVIEGNVA